MTSGNTISGNTFIGGVDPWSTGQPWPSTTKIYGPPPIPATPLDSTGALLQKYTSPQPAPPTFYTPLTEDLRIGYECEFGVESWIDEQGLHFPEGFKEGLTKTVSWRREVASSVKQLLYLEKKIGEGLVRVPHLSVAELAADGWYYQHQWGSQNRTMHEKGNFFLALDLTVPEWPVVELHVKDPVALTFMRQNPERFRVTLPCRSINELRAITRRLGI